MDGDPTFCFSGMDVIWTTVAQMALERPLLQPVRTSTTNIVLQRDFGFDIEWTILMTWNRSTADPSLAPHGSRRQ